MPIDDPPKQLSISGRSKRSQWMMFGPLVYRMSVR
jgi:hypothetical protein